MKRAIKAHITDFIAVVGLIAIAVGVSYYILQQQRLRIPVLEESPFVLNAEFQTGQAVTAGQGQTIRVSGVRIGDIGAVRLVDGKAVIEMQLDQEYRDFIHTDATALLRPKTGLKDMFIDLDPGSEGAPLAEEGFTLPIRATQPDVNPDEIYRALDADTRDYLKLLVNGAGKGLEGRGADLRDVFARFEPTHRDLARINSAVATRRKNLRRLIRSLRLLNEELARDPEQLSGLVEQSARVLRAFASEERNITASVRELPSTLSTTTDTLGKVERFARILGPAAQRLRPAARRLDDANDAVIEFAREIAPVLRSDIRPFVRESRPAVRALIPGARRLSRALPDLEGTFTRLNRLLNMAAFNPAGREGPEKADRQEGYLFWLAWLQHMGINLFSTSDAHGVFRPVTLAAPCNTIKALVAEEPELEFLIGLTAILTDSAACGTDPDGGGAARKGGGR